MPTTIDVSAYRMTTSKNGAFGFRSVVDVLPTISATGKTAELAVAGAQTKLRRHLAEITASGAPLPPEAKTVHAPKLLELLAIADQRAPAEYLERLQTRRAFAKTFANASEDTQELFCELLNLEGFHKPLSYQSDREENDDGITAAIRAWTDAPDLHVALGATLHLSHANSDQVITDVRIGIKRESTKRAAERPITIHGSDHGPALHRDEIYHALEALIDDVSLSYEAAREHDVAEVVEKPQGAYWDAMDAVDDRVTALEKSKTA